jgi:hypothetical protein
MSLCRVRYKLADCYDTLPSVQKCFAYHGAVANESLAKIDLLLIDQLTESSNFTDLLDNQDTVLSVTISSNT